MRFSNRVTAALIAVAALSIVAHPAGAVGYCKTLTGAFVGFGEETTRGDAEKALDKEISTWEQRSGQKAKQKDRKVGCKVYIGWLNEFECTAQAVLCR
jgi:hypothetical protein